MAPKTPTLDPIPMSELTPIRKGAAVVSPSPSPTLKSAPKLAGSPASKAINKGSDAKLKSIKSVKSSAGGRSNQKSCRCVKSKCLKLYCECFSSSVLCGPQCKCVDCNNTKSEVNGKIHKAKQSYLIRKPTAFTKPPKAPGQSCACRTNR